MKKFRYTFRRAGKVIDSGTYTPAEGAPLLVHVWCQAKIANAHGYDELTLEPAGKGVSE